MSEIIELITAEVPGNFKRMDFPWSHAIKLVHEGRAFALSAPAKKEAPELFYPNIPVGIQKMCFFVRKDSQWFYKGPLSLTNLQIGVAKDASLEELNGYMHEHPEQFQLQPYHGRFLKQNINKLIKRRYDAFVFSINSTLLELKRLNLLGKIKSAGCISEAPVYVACSSAVNYLQTAKYISKKFDIEMLKLAESGQLDTILNKYNAGFTAAELIDYGNMKVEIH
ncbi:ABC transporter substrate-binding protein [Colwellia sp. RSH04]|uniref:ABC transporter substrate-binding protein n=1 Tax=Colwellia sp. RSH04 TaxID=2305464 RepID=UPI000E586785|nr:ABC transporter substrate-binding protein [Colwellia sp. RSH04]RHW74746.1 hypothetical protein D1094_17080 [Colwellia sp. RSH04]